MYLARDGVTDWDLSRADVDQFRRGIGPLADAGRLAALLAQFPPSFHAEPETRDYLDWLLDALAGYPSRSSCGTARGATTAGETRARCSRRTARPGCSSTSRSSSRSISQSWARRAAEPATARSTYIRLHGRNAANWWEHDEAEDRYDYLYSADELGPVADAAKIAATGASACSSTSTITSRRKPSRTRRS